MIRALLMPVALLVALLAIFVGTATLGRYLSTPTVTPTVEVAR